MSEAQEDKLKDVARHSMALVSCSAANDPERLRSEHIQNLAPVIALHACQIQPARRARDQIMTFRRLQQDGWAGLLSQDRWHSEPLWQQTKIFIDLIGFTFATCRSSPKLTDYSFCVVCSYQYGLISTLISECSAVACSGMDVDWYNEARTLLLVFIFIWSFFSSWAPLHKCNDSGDVWWSTRCNTSGPGRLKKNVGSAKSLTWKPCVPASRRTETYQKWFVVRGDQLLGWEISDIRYKQHPFESQIFPVILLLCGTGCLFALLHTITVMRKVKQKRSN